MAMWRPTVWSDVEALLGDAEETITLDFKRELTSNVETAKDIAAMTVSGGVIVYGVDEDESRASAIVELPLSGVEEKLRQVAGSLITPTPYFDVHAIASPDDDKIGVVVLAIPASSLAPHQTITATPTDGARPLTISTSARSSVYIVSGTSYRAQQCERAPCWTRISSEPSTAWR